MPNMRVGAKEPIRKARAAFSQQLKNLQGYEITTVLAGEDGWGPVADGNKLITVKR